MLIGIICSVMIFLSAFFAQAAPFRTTYQAKIIKPDGQPLQASAVNFRFTILDPAASCALYVEDYTAINMNDTGGLVAFALGAGVRSFPTSGTAATFSAVFDNSTPSFACQTPGVYLPSSIDSRKIVMQFNDGTGWQTLPAMSINAVPYSMYASKSENSIQLNGKSDTAFVEYSSLAALNCQSNEAIHFNGVNFSCIVAGGGSVTSGSVITALGYTPADGVSVTALSSSLSSTNSTVSSVSSTVFSVSSTVSSLASSVTSLQNSVAASFAAITSSQWSNAVSGISYLSGNVGIGTTTPVTRLDVSGGVRISMESATCAASYAGTLRYNAGNVEYCNGTIWSAFGVSGAGLQSFNGSTSGTQSFANGTAGNAPAFATANGIHTLNIPYASVGTTTAGLISNTDYQNFSNKITSSSAAIAQVLGYTPASATALGNYLVKSNNLSDLTDSSAARINLGLGTFATANTVDLGSASATGTLAVARLPSFIGDATIAAASNTIILANSGVTAGTYTKVTVDSKGRVTSGSQITSSDVTTALGYTPANSSTMVSSQWNTSGTTINYTSGNVGVGTTLPEEKLHVSGTLLVTGDWGSGPTLSVSGAGTRMFFYPRKVAFRGGYAYNDEWNENNIGEGSFAYGDSVTASGSYAIAMGQYAKAYAPYAVAFGQGEAYGDYSAAFDSSIATGLYSFAVGSSSANADRAIAMGGSSSANAESSVAIGRAVRSDAYRSVAVGSYNVGGGSATAWVVTDPIFEVGNSQNGSPRSNAMTVLKNGKVGIGITTPVTALHVSGGVRISMESATCAASYAGTLRYNTGNVEFCNGTTWSAFGVSGAGLQSFNGSTSGTQTFANGTAGNAPAFVTANGIHTLNIPFASAGTTTAGLISNADYVNFNNKLSTLDLGGVSATGTLAIARMPAFTGDATIAAASNTIILANSGVTAGTYTKVTVDSKGRVTSGSQLLSGDVTTALGYTPAASGSFTSSQWNTSGTTINYVAGDVGVGTASPRQKLDVFGIQESASGTTPRGSFVVGGASTAGVLNMGVHNPGTFYSWIQSRHESSATYFNLSLNPQGGNVGIGTTSPDKQLTMHSTGLDNYIHLTSSMTGTTSLDGVMIGTGTSGDAAFYNRENTNMIFLTNNTERVRIDNTGNVGIGTSAPMALLDVSKTGTSDPIAKFGSPNPTDSVAISVGHGTSFSSLAVAGGANAFTPGAAVDDLIIRYPSGKKVLFSNGGTRTDMVVDGSGNVGVGTTTPSFKMHVKGTVMGTETTPDWQLSVSKDYVVSNGLGAGPGILLSHDTYLSGQKSAGIASPAEDAGYSRRVGLGFWTSDFDTVRSEKMRITGTGNVGIGTASPAAKLDVVGDFKFTTAGGSSTMMSNISNRDFDFQGNVAGNRVLTMHPGPLAGTGYSNIIVDFYGHNGTSTIPGFTMLRNGNIGIGTTAPAAKLEVRSSNAGALTAFTQSTANAGILIDSDIVESTHNSGIFWKSSNNNPTKPKAGIWMYNESGPGSWLLFGTSNTYATGITNTAMAINPSGNVGIGTNFPVRSLHVNGDAYINAIVGGQNNGAGNFHLDAWSSGADRSVYLNWSSGTGGAKVGNGGANYGPIAASAFNTSSDRRLKENIKPIENPLDKILKLDAVTFTWKDANRNKMEGVRLGLIAQNVEKIFPQAVRIDRGENTLPGGTKLVTYPDLVAPLIAAIKEFYSLWWSDSKELHKTIENQNREIASVKEENAQIKSDNAKMKKENEEIKARLEKLEKALSK